MKRKFKMRRDELEIIANVLNIAQEGAHKTERVYKENLNSARLERYPSYLREKERVEYFGCVYKTTEKGEDFLFQYNKMMELFIT